MAVPLAELQSWGSALMNAIPDVIAVYLGGSAVESAHETDDLSDYDISCIVDGEAPIEASIRDHWPSSLGRLETFRERPFFTEHHAFIGSQEYDVKYYPLSRFRSSIDTPPTLDEVYLDTLHAYHAYQTLADRDGRTGVLLENLEQRHLADVELLQKQAFDAYVKMVHGAVKQGIERTQTASAALCISSAAQALTQLLFLSAGKIPPPIKWRLATSRIGKVEGGSEFRSRMAAFHEIGEADIPRRLAVLAELERLVVADETAWWWRGYVARHPGQTDLAIDQAV